MFLRALRSVLPAAALAVFVLLVGYPQFMSGGRTGAQSSVTRFGHVIIVVGENAGFSQTYNANCSSAAMPYLCSLAQAYGLATNYTSDTHSSIGNYFVLSSGQILTNNDNLTPSQQTFSADNIALDAQNAGLTWKDYVENLPSASDCDAAGGGAYVDSEYLPRHDPLSYYSNIDASNIVCFNQFFSFTTDSLTANALPNFSWLALNANDNGHDQPGVPGTGCLVPGSAACVGQFDNWLKTVVGNPYSPAPGTLLASCYFRYCSGQPAPDGLLIITFDENGDLGGSTCTTSQIESGTWCGGQVETVIVSPRLAGSGIQVSNPYSGENVLALMEEWLGLSGQNGILPGVLNNLSQVFPAPVDMGGFFSVPPAAMSPNPVNFGSETVGSTSNAQAVTLANNASSSCAACVISFPASNDVSLAGLSPGDFAVQSDSCRGQSVAPGGSCSIDLTFTPSISGNQSATLTIVDSASNGPQTAYLTGFGSSPSSGSSSGSSSSTSGGGITLVAKASAAYESSTSAASNITSSAFNLPEGDLEVVYCGASGTDTAPTVSDAAGNRLVLIDNYSFSADETLAMYYAAGAQGGSSDTISCSWPNAHENLAALVMVYRGVAANSPLDKYAIGAANDIAAVTTSAFPVSAGELVVAGMMSGDGCMDAPGAGSGYVMQVTAQPSSCPNAEAQAATEDLVSSSSQSGATASMSFTYNKWANMIAATFKPASAATSAISLVSKASGAYESSSNIENSVTTQSFDLPQGDLAVVYCGVTGADGAPSVSDAAGNQFVPVDTYSAQTEATLTMFYAANAQAESSDAVTCSWPTGHENLSALVLVYQGVAASSPLDQYAIGEVDDSTPLATRAFSVAAGELVVAGMVSGSGCTNAPSAGSGYVMQLDAQPSTCSDTAAQAAVEAQVSSGSQSGATAAMSFPTGVWANMIAGTFKPAQ